MEHLYCKCFFYACKFCERDAQKGIVRKETAHNSLFLTLIEELITYIKISVCEIKNLAPEPRKVYTMRLYYSVEWEAAIISLPLFLRGA